MSVYRIKEGEIAVGKPLTRAALDENGVLLLRKGYVITSAAQLESLMERGLFFGDAAESTEQAEPEVEDPSPFDMLDNAYQRLSRFFNRFPNEEDFPNKILSIVDTISDACKKDKDATLGSIFLLMWNDSQYVVKHPIHAAIIAEVLCQLQNLTNEQRRSIVAATLTMNISVLRLQEALHHQKEALTDQQRQQLRAHPEETVTVLKNAGVVDPVWLESVTQHHERLDGTGYPKGLKGGEISLGGEIVMLADNYSAKVSNRADRNEFLPNVALRDIFLQRGSIIKPEIAALFIKELGVYPPGTFVRLQNGEIAVVTRRGSSANCPLVSTVVGPRGAPLVHPISRDSGKSDFVIQETVSGKVADIKVNPYQLWGYAKKS